MITKSIFTGVGCDFFTICQFVANQTYPVLQGSLDLDFMANLLPTSRDDYFVVDQGSSLTIDVNTVLLVNDRDPNQKI